MLRPLYEGWFRVRSYGAENIPSDGGAIIAANHSGTLPFDGAMLYMDVLCRSDPPRLPRPVGDTFIPRLPFVSVFFARGGVVAGSRSNVKHLLESGELLLVFPEGVPGIAKPIWKRYQLQKWRVGHCELAIRYGVPVVPVGIVGAEEQMPQVGKLDVRLFGAPYLPLPVTPVPLPVRYHIHYGEPIPLHERYRPEQADDPAVIGEAALQVQNAVRDLLRRGLKQRKGIFR